MAEQTQIDQVRDFMLQPYGLADLEADMTKVKPRFMDTWVIPPLMIWLALRLRSGQALGRWPRRMLFTAGAYMLMRNYASYKTSIASLAAIAQSKGSSNV